MAKLYISEFNDVNVRQGALTPIVPGVASVEQTPVTITGTSAQSAAFGAESRIVRLHTDVVCSVLFGSSPTATANSRRLAANQTEYFRVNPGDKVAVISNT